MVWCVYVFTCWFVVMWRCWFDEFVGLLWCGVWMCLCIGLWWCGGVVVLVCWFVVVWCMDVFVCRVVVVWWCKVLPHADRLEGSADITAHFCRRKFRCFL